MKIGLKVLENTALPKFEAMPGIVQAELLKTYEVVGSRVAESARGIVPVRTGALRASISYEVRGTSVVVGAGMYYAGYVEYGTRKMRARPYLRPALQSNLAYIESKFLEAVMAAMLR